MKPTEAYKYEANFRSDLILILSKINDNLTEIKNVLKSSKVYDKRAFKKLDTGQQFDFDFSIGDED